MWEQLGFAEETGKMAMQNEWPQYDETKMVEAVREMAVQVNGKLRATIKVPTDSDDATVIAAAQAEEKVKRQMEGMVLVKTIVVKNKLVNLIVKPAK